MTPLAQPKSEILVVGCGGIGALCAYNLEVGQLASVTAVLRSNYQAVVSTGFNISSLEHGEVTHWRPSRGEEIHPSLMFVARL